MGKPNQWETFVREDYGFLRAMRVLLSVLLLFVLLFIGADWRTGSINGYGVFTFTVILSVIGWISYLLKKYKPK